MLFVILSYYFHKSQQQRGHETSSRDFTRGSSSEVTRTLARISHEAAAASSREAEAVANSWDAAAAKIRKGEIRNQQWQHHFQMSCVHCWQLWKDVGLLDNLKSQAMQSLMQIIFVAWCHLPWDPTTPMMTFGMLQQQQKCERWPFDNSAAFLHFFLCWIRLAAGNVAKSKQHQQQSIQSGGYYYRSDVT